MKFKFDPNQEFQLQAINSIVDCFEGQEKTTAQTVAGLGLFGIYPNVLTLSPEDIHTNIKKIQESNTVKCDPCADMDLSIEMETGTGKTYVYLRTIFELNQKYGWKKFIILVPSVAIREGVIKTLQITEDHFKDLYANTPFRFYE